MGEEVEVANYERFTPLAVEAAGLKGGYKNVQPGDCIVAFSRKTIFAIKQVCLTDAMFHTVSSGICTEPSPNCFMPNLQNTLGGAACQL